MFNALRPDFSVTPASDECPDFPYVPRQGPDAAKAPAVSLITPFYNTGPEFLETVLSVQRQTLQNLEWLVVNDGSTNSDSLALLEEFKASVAGDDRIRVIELDANVGVSAARNRGVEQARAEFVAFLDSDDLLEPTALEKWAWFLGTHPEVPWANSQIVGFDAFEYYWTEGFHLPEKFLERNAANPHGIYRKAFFEQVGGHDESIRDGLEDWEFWMRCASLGYWGQTIKDPLIWYRRRDNHADRWDDFDESDRSKAFGDRLRAKYAEVWSEQGFPDVGLVPKSMAPVEHGHPIANPLQPASDQDGAKNLLVILPHMEMGGSDKFNLDLLDALVRTKGWRVTIATTRGREGGSWLQELGAITPDVFVLGRFVGHADWPRFLTYLIESRGIDAVLVSHSTFGYQVLPYLQSRCPDVVFTDYLHIEMEEWKSGGYPRFALHYQESLDCTITSSEHLKQWLVDRGGDSACIEVCSTNIDPTAWNPSGIDSAEVAKEFGLDPDACLVLFAGRLCAQKQPEVLMRTALELCRDQDGFQLAIAGDGEDGDWVRAFHEQHAADMDGKVVLLGELPNTDIRRLLVAADIFFLPSQHEGIALSLFESMVMETVVVGAAVGGQPELVTADLGTLIQPGTPTEEQKSYVEALSRWISDTDSRNTAAKASRKRIVDHFQLAAMVDRMASLLLSPRQAPVRTDPLPETALHRHTVEICEQARLDDEARELWEDNQSLREDRTKLRAKVENFRGMITRRDEKIEHLKGKSSGSGKKGSALGKLTRKVKKSLAGE